MGYDLYQMEQKQDARRDAERKEAQAIFNYAMAERIVINEEYMSQETKEKLRKIYKRILLEGIAIGERSKHITDTQELLSYVRTL